MHSPVARTAALVAATLLFSVTSLPAGSARQQQPAPSTKTAPLYVPREKHAPLPAELSEIDDIIHKQFGNGFTLIKDFPTPMVVADLDGDGIQDAVIVAKAEKPLDGQAEFDYHAIDPYDDYFGFGDPRVTSQFNIHDSERTKYLLIIHGDGPQAWRAAKPKAKFVVINLPFDRLGIGKVMIKKIAVTAISAEETSIESAVVYWDAKKKKYRWAPNTSLD